MMKYVYIIKAGENHYKVGVSLTPKKRLAGIQTGNGRKAYLVTMKLCEHATVVEHRLHQHLQSMSAEGGSEWFILEPEDVLRLCILLHQEPEIDVFVNVDLNKQLVEDNLRHKRLEKKLDALINIAQKPRATIFNPDPDLVAPQSKMTTEEQDKDLYHEAYKVVVAQGRASTSLLQRRLRIGYGRAARVLEELEEQGVVAPADGARPRQVLVPTNAEIAEDAMHALIAND